MSHYEAPTTLLGRIWHAMQKVKGNQAEEPIDHISGLEFGHM